jgi:rhodanese-related sulfurtransferase/peroxiredoxin
MSLASALRQGPAGLLGGLLQLPLPVGARAPRFSLTADDGAWVRLADLEGRAQAVLLFLRRLDDETAAWLRAYDALGPRWDALGARVVACHTASPPALRAFKAAHGLSLPIAYDPLAVDARGWRAASRWSPASRDAVAVVGADGALRLYARGRRPVDEVLALFEAPAAPPAPATGAPAAVTRIDSAQAVALLTAASSPYRLVDVRTRSEFEADHAPMAIHVPVDELPQRHTELGAPHHLIFVCQAGGRSAAAAEFMASIGGTALMDVAGGMSAWSGPRVTGGQTA